MSKPWGSIGDWAADVEREEQEAASAAAAAPSGGASASASSQSFPSLREAVTAKPKKKKMTLTEFHTSSPADGGAFSSSRGLTPDEMFRLPTGPKERSAEEMQYGRHGGGFSNYGGKGLGSGRTRDTDGAWANNNNNSRRQYGGFDDERRGPAPARVSDYDQPSRADEVDNWAMTKKSLVSTPSFDSGNRQSRYGGGLGGGGGFGGGGGGSRADEVDNWASVKKPFVSSTPMSETRSSTFGSGFRDYSGVGGGPDNDRWTSRGGGIREPERERPRLVLNAPKGDLGGGAVNEVVVKTNKSNPFGAARPREDVLAEKGLDWKKLDLEIEAKKTSSHSSRPNSAHSSRPSSAHSVRSESLGLQQGLENVAVKPRPKVNPFGDAKPREVLLQERGQDWRKIDLDLEHRRVDRSETEDERLLKEEIEYLKKEAQKEGSVQLPGGGQPSSQDIISQKEKELEQIIRDLDDKVRFGQKAVERPGSGAGRAGSFSERPPSQSGSFDESRSMEYMDRPRSRGTQDTWTRPGMEYMDRPRSRGTQDTWTRPGDERKAFHGGRERGFPGSRDFDRSSSGDRW